MWPGAHTALVVVVPEAEAAVGELRRRFDPSAQAGVPAHITVLYPFMPLAQLSPSALAQVAAAVAGVPAFRFTLRRVARFPATAYLAPEPAAPFVALTEALVRAFPAWPPFGGEHTSIVPHLTVAHGDAGQAPLAAAELSQRMQACAPIDAICRQVSLLHNGGGGWCEMHRFALPQP